MGRKPQKRGDTCIHTAGSPCRTTEMNTALYSNYTPVQVKQTKSYSLLPPGPWPVCSETRLTLSQDHPDADCAGHTAQAALPAGLWIPLMRKERRGSGGAQSCPTLRDPMDCSPPGSSVHGVLQARILEWAPMSFSRGSSQPGLEAGLPLCRQRLCLLSPQREVEAVLQRGLRGGVRTCPLCA